MTTPDARTRVVIVVTGMSTVLTLLLVSIGVWLLFDVRDEVVAESNRRTHQTGCIMWVLSDGEVPFDMIVNEERVDEEVGEACEQVMRARREQLLEEDQP